MEDTGLIRQAQPGTGIGRCQHLPELTEVSVDVGGTGLSAVSECIDRVAL
jgi:hypothetical protein